jgi:hypothetical protein
VGFVDWEVREKMTLKNTPLILTNEKTNQFSWGKQYVYQLKQRSPTMIGIDKSTNVIDKHSYLLYTRLNLITLVSPVGGVWAGVSPEKRFSIHASR